MSIDEKQLATALLGLARTLEDCKNLALVIANELGEQVLLVEEEKPEEAEVREALG